MLYDCTSEKGAATIRPGYRISRVRTLRDRCLKERVNGVVGLIKLEKEADNTCNLRERYTH